MNKRYFLRRISIIQPRETIREPIESGKVAYPGVIRDINAERPVKPMEPAKIKLVKIVENLEKPAVLPPIGDDPVCQCDRYTCACGAQNAFLQVSKQWVERKLEVEKQNVGTQMAQITRHVAQVVNLTAPPVQERDHIAIEKAVNTMYVSVY